MDWMNWKTWAAVAIIILGAFAVYTIAAPDAPRETPEETVARSAKNELRSSASVTGLDPVHKEWIEPQPAKYKSDRNLFEFRQPPPPPPPPAPKTPPDRDHDSIPDFKDNCVATYNPDQADVDHNGIGDVCDPNFVPPPPPPPPKPVPPSFDYKYIGTFGDPRSPLATFARADEIVNVRVGDTIDGRFILRSIGLESVEIGYVGFPPDEKDRIPIGH